MSFEVADLLGPLGGTIALSWGAGAASGYIFATKIMRSRISYLEEQIKISDKKCESRLAAMTNRFESEIETVRQMSKEAITQSQEAQRIIAEIKRGG